MLRNKGIVGVFYFLSKKSFFKRENRYNLRVKRQKMKDEKYK